MDAQAAQVMARVCPALTCAVDAYPDESLGQSEVKMRFVRSRLAWGILLCLWAGAAAADVWIPPWDSPKKLSSLDRVERTEEPLVFLVLERRVFDAQEEARAFGEKQARFVEITPGESDGKKRFHCWYGVAWDLAAVVPEAERELWYSDIGQYALYAALKRDYWSGSVIEDGKLWIPRNESFAREDEFSGRLRAEGARLTSKTWITHPDGRTSLQTSRLVPVDFLAEARKTVYGITFANEHLIPERIGDYICMRPGASEGVSFGTEILSGTGGLIQYINTGNEPKKKDTGASVHAYLAKTDSEFDHGYLTHFILNVGAEIHTLPNGQVVVSGLGGAVNAWKSGPRTYYEVACRDPLVLETYLKKFPSVLPADYSIDLAAWKLEEVTRCIGRMANAVEQPDGESNRYLWEYEHLCRFLEPIEGAPLFLPWEVRLDVAERRQHFAAVSAWWNEKRGNLTFPWKKPMSRSEVNRKTGDGKARQQRLEAFRKSVKELQPPQ